MIRTISISGGIPTIFLPLTAITMISALKDVLEDMKRYRSDKEENKRKILIFRGKSFIEEKWEDIHVGDIVKVNRDEFFPCDITIVKSSNIKGFLFQTFRTMFH